MTRVLVKIGFMVLALVFTSAAVASSERRMPSSPGVGARGAAAAHYDGISPLQRARIDRRIAAYEARKGIFRSLAIIGPQPYPFYPQAGTLGQDLFINNATDLNTAVSALQDFECSANPYTYDGHQGYDTDLRSFREQAIGVPVFAVLDGTVVDSHDGEPDMNTTAPNVAANYVVLHHGGTHYSWYWHLRNGSVAVSNSQVVKVGQQLGQTASSGRSTGPHLHFESRYNATWYEPSAGPCNPGQSNWVNQAPLRKDVYARDFAFSTGGFSGANGLPLDQAPRTGAYLSGLRDVWFRWQVANSPIGPVRIKFRRPNNTLLLDFQAFNNTQFFRQGWWWWHSIPNLDQLGTWTLIIEANGQPIIQAPFEVVASQAQIVNRAPNPVASVSIDSAPSLSNALTCRTEHSLVTEDPNYDILRYRYVWSAGGTVLRDSTNAASSDLLARSSVPAGAPVTCSVTPSDGQLSGPTRSQRTIVAGSTGSFATGPIDCNATAPHMTVRAPVVYSRDPSNVQYIFWRSHFIRYDGANWQYAGAAPFLVSFAPPNAPADTWYDYDTGAAVGSSSAVRQEWATSPPGNYWLAYQEFWWVTAEGQVAGSEVVLSDSANGPNAAGGMACYWAS